MRTFKNFDEIKAAVGSEIGASDWLVVTQERIDQFASAPDYFAEGDEEAKPLIESWAGNADRLGEALGKPSRDIDPYLVRVDFESELGKAFADDAFALDDFWVFTDICGGEWASSTQRI